MKPEFIDIHAHLYFHQFDEDREQIIQQTINNKVAVINVGVNLETSKQALELAEKNKNFYAVVGFHPLYVDEINIEDFKELEQILKHPKCIGIGECGLDYSNTDKTLKEKQKDYFVRQISLACEYKKPLMIHCRGEQNDNTDIAYSEILEILKSYKKIHPELKVNFHFFNQNTKLAQEILDLGFQFSFTGIITFVKELEKVVKFAPEDKIMSETDSPYVAPRKHRGEKNNPNYVIEIVEKIADIKKIPLNKLKKQLLNNAESFFNITLQ